ncbi:MAG: ABC transporter permease [Anaerolineaceae bacterium]|jgi:peptide/nickel transport system permease protein|nr:MAG: ABC transporter permease [Anaerolineaceae bacterium]
MPPLLQFVIRRFMSIPVSLLVITMVLYGGVMLTPPEARATLYMPDNLPPRLTDQQYANIEEKIIRLHHLRDPFPVQYYFWVKTLFDGKWGYSPSLNEYVLPSLLRRTPATLELAVYSLLLLIPLGLVSGVTAGWKRSGSFDRGFRALAFLGTSIPPFILAIVLLSIFYINLSWFFPGRLDLAYTLEISAGNFIPYTGMMTVDALLNGRTDILDNAFRHLAMPAFTLSIYHWATLGRVTRVSMLGEKRKEYVTAAKARGLVERKIVWKHVFRNILTPSLTSMALSATSIVTGVFVSEIIYDIDGISGVIVRAMSGIPDAPAALGFAMYSVIMTLLLTFFLDVTQAILDPRVREGVLKT